MLQLERHPALNCKYIHGIIWIRNQICLPGFNELNNSLMIRYILQIIIIIRNKDISSIEDHYLTILFNSNGNLLYNGK